jgi:hypothetical protein
MSDYDKALEAGFTETWLKNEKNLNKLSAFADIIRQSVTPREDVPQANLIIRERYGNDSDTGR